MANTGSRGIAKYIDFFAADTVAGGSAGGDGSAADGIAWIGSSFTGDTPFARAVSAGRGIHLTSATDTTNNDTVEIASDALMFTAQEGYCMVEILFQQTSIADVAWNFGFNDTWLESAHAGTLPVELSTATWTTTSTDFCGLAYDTNATNDEVHCMWVSGGVDTTTALASLRMNGAVPVASKWMYARVELQDQGSGYSPIATFLFEVDGKTFEKRFQTTMTRSTPLCLYFGFENRTTTAKTFYTKMLGWEQTISD